MIRAQAATTRRRLVFDAFRALVLRAVACVDRRKHTYLLSRSIPIDAFITGCLLHQVHIFSSQFLGQMVEKCRHGRIGGRIHGRGCRAVHPEWAVASFRNQIARRRGKTDVAVSLPIPDEVVSLLQRLPTPAGRFFWSGQGKLKSAVANWQRSLTRLFDLAGIVGGHPHRFGHTFSVDLLSKGVSLENVSKALGHSIVKITEKFYGAWVKSTQEALDSEIRKAWAL